MASHNGLITIFSFLRIGVGAIGLSPSLTTKIFGININSESGIVSRLFGARELALGIMLWLVNNRQGRLNGVPTSEGHRDLRTLLAAGLCIDAADVVSSLVSIYEGSMSEQAIWLVGGGAVAASCAGAALLKMV
jgi:hypothetical protein